MLDENVEAVVNRHKNRAELGLQKYGVTTERQDLTVEDWLSHLQEEVMDAAVYIEVIKKRLNQTEELQGILRRIEVTCTHWTCTDLSGFYDTLEQAKVVAEKHRKLRKHQTLITANYVEVYPKE